MSYSHNLLPLCDLNITDSKLVFWIYFNRIGLSEFSKPCLLTTLATECKLWTTALWRSLENKINFFLLYSIFLMEHAGIYGSFCIVCFFFLKKISKMFSHVGAGFTLEAVLPSIEIYNLQDLSFDLWYGRLFHPKLCLHSYKHFWVILDFSLLSGKKRRRWGRR